MNVLRRFSQRSPVTKKALYSTYSFVLRQEQTDYSEYNSVSVYGSRTDCSAILR